MIDLPFSSPAISVAQLQAAAKSLESEAAAAKILEKGMLQLQSCWQWMAPTLDVGCGEASSTNE